MSLDLSSCEYCQGPFENLDYSLNGYALLQCRDCLTTRVSEMPSQEELSKYYQGFRFQADVSNRDRVNTPKMKAWMASMLGGKAKASMLDVGGGGGFFAKAFEDFGFGMSTYVDLDEDACSFAQKEMRLERVICDDVSNISEVCGEKYDFIYCRHVVEHLQNPISLIRQCVDLLNDGGVFVLQCPNARSKEGFLFPQYWRRFLRNVKEENGWSERKAYLVSLSKRYAWGIDPIRHLWGVTGKGMRKLLKDYELIDVKVMTAGLNDPVFSPYWSSSSISEQISSKLSRVLVPQLISGMHLVTIISKKECR